MPELAASPESPNTLSFFQNGPVARAFLLVLLGSGALFIGAMSAWMTEDSFLDCARTEPMTARCTERQQFAFGYTRAEQLPPIGGARADRRIEHDKNGRHTVDVLLLEVSGAPALEFNGVGTNGARAGEVASGVRTFLGGEGASPAQWHLRESAPWPLVALMLAMALGLLILVGMSFRRVQLELDPIGRTLTLRRGRWPATAAVTTVPIDDVNGWSIFEKRTRNAVSYGANLNFKNRPPAEVGIASVGEETVRRKMADIEAQLAIWKQL